MTDTQTALKITTLNAQIAEWASQKITNAATVAANNAKLDELIAQNHATITALTPTP